MTYTAKELEKMILADGWFVVRKSGSHKQYHHPTKAGTVTISFHSGNLPIGTARNILRQAGLL